MRLVVDYLGWTVLTQLVLLLVFWFGREYIEAAHELYRYSPALFYFYVVGSGTTLWFFVSAFRAYVLRTGLGERGRRHSRTRGLE